MNKHNQIMVNVKQELRRGTLVITVLLQLDEPRYGYSLVQDLEEQGIIIDQSTLYPLLRRLEKQELVTSDWNVEEKRPRKYYQITGLGKTARASLYEEWKTLQTAITKMAKKGGLVNE